MRDRSLVLKEFESNKEFFEKTIYPNIEKYRKGDMTITVVDQNGNIVSNAKIKVKQIQHDFRFGANLFMLDELETEEKNCLYKDYFKNVFNMATLPFYWNAIEEIRGQQRYAKDSYRFYRRPPIDLCIEYCEKNGIEPREHGLAYDQTYPLWLKGAPIDIVKVELERRFREISERYASKIRTIEVTNEMYWGEGVTDFYTHPSFLEWVYKTADKYFPNNQLTINEGTGEAWLYECKCVAPYYAYTEATKLKGARVDAMGMQFHMFYSREEELEKSKKLYNPVHLYNQMNLYSNLVDYLQITEITIPAYSNDPLDEEIQAKLIEYLYTVWFSHPKMEQIIYWNMIDGYAYIHNPNKVPEKIRESQGNMTIGENIYYGGLLRFDMTQKPAYRILDELINKRWRTNLDITTTNGKADLRGFYGEYEITVAANGKTTTKAVHLSSKKQNNFEIVI
ncbi:MAG: endo-1,4-beta-xylanase [Clostridia bacterium]|nr:endo-1,4-beta-xylanase [Clostridia bacterium]